VSVSQTRLEFLRRAAWRDSGRFSAEAVWRERLDSAKFQLLQTEAQLKEVWHAFLGKTCVLW
jgi:hypothetical protein